VYDHVIGIKGHPIVTYNRKTEHIIGIVQSGDFRGQRMLVTALGFKLHYRRVSQSHDMLQ
jgi:hypothetical protein